MYTLVYINGHLNRPDTLSSFLNLNIGESPLLRVDCVTPFKGTEQELIKEVCTYLNRIDPHVEVNYNITQNVSTETNVAGNWVHFLVMQINISER